ncbi:cAMP-regulated phosphoprotein 19-related protein [Perilla frutescens var. hirtella]|uniref:cAMP-regulated phosphoprotein 19-related protein n=1 Tax=Perilla frutescens var. hirtella TaxID=608512 RepID=A0AAD4IWM8_PERFH|nr:cAMP-regulated phosphoprotein 19-related protein [Perilla frutescens var. hirtella]
MAEEKNAVEVEESESSLSPEDSKDVDTRIENQMPSHQQEEEVIKKKYGGLLSKKPPLISKDNERAFFDSADWALGKKSKGPLEALRPKLQPTPHQQLRSRSLCAPADDDHDHNHDHGEADDCNSDDLNHDPSLDIHVVGDQNLQT